MNAGSIITPAQAAAERDPYYGMPEVSNSDLSWLQKQFMAEADIIDAEQAYRFGTLLDCMITEPYKIDFFKHTCAGNLYTAAEFELAEQMKKSFYRDPLAKALADASDFQKISVKHGFKVVHDGFSFILNVRCKWDLYAQMKLQLTGDIKSTTATTLQQFIDACHHFQYFRQRAWYMDIDRANGHRAERDVLIGVSKRNCQVFKIPITRGDKYYNEGLVQYQRLSFKYATLFGSFQAA